MSGVIATALAQIQPAPETDAPTSQFPLDCLPPAAQEMATAICGAVGVPESLSGPAVLGVLSAAVGAGLEVRSGPVRTPRANLYIVVSAESGTGKSETMRLAAAPLWACETEDIERYRHQTLPGAQAEWEIINVEIGRLKKLAAKDLTQEGRAKLQDDLCEKKAALTLTEATMQAPVLTVEDTTVERLAVLLSHRRETLTSLSSDAGAIVNNLLGRYNKTDRTDETLYLKAWTGENCRVDRQGRDAIWLVRPWLSALWFVQPDKVATLLAVESLKDGGFIQRLLLCHSGCGLRKLDKSGRVDGTTDFSQETADTWNGLVRELVLEFRKCQDPSRIVTPTSAASELFIGHYNSMVDRWKQGELRDVTSHAVRWTEQAWRIALCIHAGLNGKSAAAVQLDVSTAECALKLADWFAQQQLAILEETRADQRRARLNQLLRVIEESGGERTLRDLVCRNRFDEAEVRRLAVEFPASFAISKQSTGGRPSEVARLGTASSQPSANRNGTHPPAAKASKASKRGQ